jgi:dCTP diphosphatase
MCASLTYEPGFGLSDSELIKLRDALRQFAGERDWEQFHSPKNLAAALSVEAAELLEHFQWLTEDESKNLSAESRHAVSLEAADVLLYLVRLSDKLNIDLIASAQEKMLLNAKKYPIEKARGSSKKYDEL